MEVLERILRFHKDYGGDYFIVSPIKDWVRKTRQTLEGRRTNVTWIGFLGGFQQRIFVKQGETTVDLDMDPTWQWCERVKENNRLKLKCSFCGNTFSGGISRMKHHLAGTSKDASPCGGGPNKPLPPFVRQQCLDMLHDLRQKRIQEEIDQVDVGYNEPLEDEEEEEEAYECDDEDDSNLRTNLDTSRGRDRRGKGIMYEGGRSGITGRKRRGTADIRVRRGMRPPSGRVPTVNTYRAVFSYLVQ
ncbi:hypothetical protein EJ110_NYTH41707 [Nymphaea thermarum]|nr:hypothetical protein EJ110_NYTH41707 [Nymphaea thermarum]